MTGYFYRNVAHVPMGGVEIIVNDMALKETDERMFPASKNRSRRIHKKLVKRFGGEFRTVPAIWRMGDKIIMHPERYAEFQKAIAVKARDSYDRSYMQALTSHPEPAREEG